MASLRPMFVVVRFVSAMKTLLSMITASVVGVASDQTVLGDIGGPRCVYVSSMRTDHLDSSFFSSGVIVIERDVCVGRAKDEEEKMKRKNCQWPSCH